MSKSPLAAVVWLAGLGAAGWQALALASRYFQPWLSADYLYPQLFAEDVLAGIYPLAGWTLSSAPYFFPDMVVAIVLRVLGGDGTVLPAYVACYFLALAVVSGWSLQRATGTGWAAWLGGVALVNLLLLWQPVTDHAHYLWLLGTVGFHGGAILLGMVSFALWVEPAQNPMSRSRWLVAVAVLFLGILSDTLFLTQAALPLGVGLWVQGGRKWRGSRALVYGQTLLMAVGLVAAVRIGLALAGWFNFSKVVRYAPTPAAVSTATTNFVRDLHSTLAPGAWGFLVMAGLALVVVGLLWWRERRQQRPLAHAIKPAMAFALVGLAATTLLPLLTAYWRDAHHVRYILPWLVLPGWLALVWLLPFAVRWGKDRRVLAALGLGWVSLAGVAFASIQSPALRWPYPERQAQLDSFLLHRGLTYGLSDYWHAHEINTLTRAPVHLFPLRPTGRASFWNNNAFRFYKTADSRARLEVPEYTFIITTGLDEAALLRRFAEPAGRERVGELTVWLYASPGAERLTRSMEEEVRGFLRGRPGVDRIAIQP